MAAFKLQKDDREKLCKLIADDYTQHATPDDLKSVVNKMLIDGLKGELSPLCELDDTDLVHELKIFSRHSIGELVNLLVGGGIDQKAALMIAHEYSDCVEQLAEAEQAEAEEEEMPAEEAPAEESEESAS